MNQTCLSYRKLDSDIFEKLALLLTLVFEWIIPHISAGY